MASQQRLHQCDVEPSVELAADLSFDANELETAGFVECDGCCARTRDPGEHGVKPRCRTDTQQLVQHQLADALATAISAYVDGVLDARAVRGALLVRRQRAEADDVAELVSRVDGHDGGKRTAAIGDPLLLLT